MSIKQELDLEEMIKKIRNFRNLGLNEEDVIKLIGIDKEDYDEIKKYEK